ncbi:beta-N-acetylhexosaminidase [Microbispora corallina]|uniref:beta-N-acetylhexosaminidase n=1 Tax=Microbispora corallina TaxID=83302 RepID=A0ABQ4FXQ1_9ACTN|nr:beta-N-acetylhexosaminidase [Microbispora corallina]GIH39590.1 beta-N-acetylhexosaminidase [Microbispora corallina]
MTRRLTAVLASAALITLSCAQPSTAAEGPPQTRASAVNVPGLVPEPVSVQAAGGTYEITAATRIVVPTGDGFRAASGLAAVLRRSTGFPLPIVRSGTGIVLDAGGGVGHGDEGYRLTVSTDGVLIRADSGEGLFRGVQTLRQLLPAAVESRTRQPGPWKVAGVEIEDYPRFAYRGAMLDVARHFFDVGEVKRYIDLAVAYKVNVLHLHLSDDQGWRIAIKSWPRLTTVGGRTAVDGDPGGYYTLAEYKDIVRYARERYVTVVPEIDTPGHTNAALASYAKLNCDGKARKPYTGTDVGFSSLCTGKEITYRFLGDVVGELAKITPGPYIDLGGDEAQSTQHADYVAFVDRVQKIVHRYGKSLMGWEEIAGAHVSPDSVAEHWNPVTGTQEGTENAREAAAKGVKLVMAPADHAYLDMKYTASTPLGQDWAGLVEARDSYDWDPARLITGVGEDDVLGVEAPIWTETLRKPADLEFMAYPRLPGIAEIGWSPASSHSWADYRTRVAAQGPRWTAASVDFYRSPQIPF